MSRQPAGLCDRCRHQKLIHNTRGSTFSLCELSKSDPAFHRYPRLPVESCAGFSPSAASDSSLGRGGEPEPE